MSSIDIFQTRISAVLLCGRGIRGSAVTVRCFITHVQLRQEFETLEGVVAQWQRLIELLDSKDRERNMVITGIPEGAEALEGATTDLDKCQKVLSKIGAEDVNPVQISRIGKQEQNRKRPLLIRLDSKNERDGVLENTKRLKDAGNAYRYIFVKDTNPSVWREWKRLRDAETTEKQKPDNQGYTIELDFRKTCVTA